MIFIKSRREGFRRCGVPHTKAGQEFEDDFFTTDQEVILENEPMLDVRLAPDKPKPDPDDDDLQALIDAGKKAIEDGNVIGSGAPSVEAMEDILGFNIIAAQRDVAWQAIQEENKAE